MLILAPVWGQCCWLLRLWFTLTQTNESSSYTAETGADISQASLGTIYRRLHKLYVSHTYLMVKKFTDFNLA